ncbi:MAG TPA: aerial mycelium formation protein [Actinomycetota bacterium]|nr:aerial mycelium formation protein [Actinomycetota bacterium]
MTEPKRRLVERILDPGYLEGLSDKLLEDLRSMRDECKEAETEISFERRLAQARIDILSAELDRRAGGGDDDLMSKLPQILATEGRSEGGLPLPSRAPDFSIPRNADIPRRRIEEIVGEQTLSRLPSLPSEELRGILGSLGDHEKALSTRRKVVQEVMDTVQAEIVRRYVSGEADPTAALG